MDQSPSPFSPVRGILEIGALVACVVIGYMRVSPVTGFLLGLALLEIAYLLVRYPQVRKVWAHDRAKIARLLLLQIAANVVIATIAYWLGRGIANLLH
jgi:hypothetical protein